MSIVAEAVSRKTEAVPLGGGLSIYKQPKKPGRGSPYWYARANVDVGGKRVHVKSTGTTDRREAERIAHEFKTDLLIEQRTGGAYVGGKLSDRGFRFDVITDAWLDHLAKLAGGNDRKLRRLRDHRKIVTGAHGLSKFYGKADIRTITGESVGEFLSFAEENSRLGELRPTTKRNLIVTLRQILRFALDKRLIERVPTFPTIRVTDNPRPAFNEEEIRKLIAEAKGLAQHARDAGETEKALQLEELDDFLGFMLGSFLRPSEWADLRHKHVEIVQGPYPHLRIAVVRGKTKERSAVTMPGAVTAYRRLVARTGDEAEQFLFLPERLNRETAKEKMRDRFDALLRQTGLTFDAFGRKRVIYSLRHTALTLRLLNGDKVDLLALARNAGTSVKMLECFYCSGLDPAAKIENLQSLKPSLSRGRPSLLNPSLAPITKGAGTSIPIRTFHSSRSASAPADLDAGGGRESEELTF